MRPSSSKLLLASAFAFAAAGPAGAAGKTLDETLAFIRDSLAGQGKITYTIAMHDTTDNSDWSTTMTSEASNVTYDASKCNLSYHWLTSADGKTDQDVQGVMNFAHGKSVAAVNREQEIRTQLINVGRPNESGIVTPPVWVVTFDETDTSNSVNFTDQGNAEKFVRAVDHAMDLCNAPKEGF